MLRKRILHEQKTGTYTIIRFKKGSLPRSLLRKLIRLPPRNDHGGGYSYPTTVLYLTVRLRGRVFLTVLADRKNCNRKTTILDRDTLASQIYVFTMDHDGCLLIHH